MDWFPADEIPFHQDWEWEEIPIWEEVTFSFAEGKELYHVGLISIIQVTGQFRLPPFWGFPITLIK